MSSIRVDSRRLLRCSWVFVDMFAAVSPCCVVCVCVCAPHTLVSTGICVCLPALFEQIPPAAPPLFSVPILETPAARRWRTVGSTCSGERREPKRGTRRMQHTQKKERKHRKGLREWPQQGVRAAVKHSFEGKQEKQEIYKNDESRRCSAGKVWFLLLWCSMQMPSHTIHPKNLKFCRI